MISALEEKQKENKGGLQNINESSSESDEEAKDGGSTNFDSILGGSQRFM